MEPTDVRLRRVHLKVLPAETLRDPDSPPLVLCQDAEEARVAAGEVTVGGRESARAKVRRCQEVQRKRSARNGRAAATGDTSEMEGSEASARQSGRSRSQRWTHLFGMSFNMGLGRMTWRYSKLSSESAGRRRREVRAEDRGWVAGSGSRRRAGCVSVYLCAIADKTLWAARGRHGPAHGHARATAARDRHPSR